MSNKTCNYISSDEEEVYLDFIVNDTHLDKEQSLIVDKVLAHIETCAECKDSISKDTKAYAMTEYICNRFKSIQDKVRDATSIDLSNVDYEWLLPKKSIVDNIQNLFDKVNISVTVFRNRMSYNVTGLVSSSSRGGEDSSKAIYSKTISGINFNVSDIIDDINISQVKLFLVSVNNDSYEGKFVREDNNTFVVFPEYIKVGKYSVKVVTYETN